MIRRAAGIVLAWEHGGLTAVCYGAGSRHRLGDGVIALLAKIDEWADTGVIAKGAHVPLQRIYGRTI
jgi:hypothetical protein